MRRAGAPSLATLAAACLAAALLAGLAGCGGGQKSGGDNLTFETLPDTVGLADGPALIDSLVVERMAGGSLRVRALTRFPRGTRLRVTIKPAGARNAVAMSQVVVEGGMFETPPLMSFSGPLPVARYSIEVSGEFTPAAQSPDVMRGTDDGKALRGPGITRTRIGQAMFWKAEEVTR